MAGKRQHYLPRFLLSGFASKVSKGDSFCWVYRKSGKYFEANTTKVGVEKFFYGDPDKDSTDSVITKAEPKYANFLSQLRNSDVSQPVDSKLAAEFTVHLAVRNRNLREEFSSAAENFVDGFIEQISDPNVLRQTVIKYFRENPAELEQQFRKILKQQGVFLNRRQYRQKLAEHKAMMPSMINSLSEAELTQISNQMDVLAGHVRPSAKKGHNKAIARDHAPLSRVEAISSLDWKLHDFAAHSLILGDFGAYAYGNNQQDPCALVWAAKEVDVVILPISHRRLMMGQRSGKHFLPEPCEVNQKSASISREFFVSSESSDERMAFVPLIGTTRPHELHDAAESALRDL